ncbi:glycerophosphodiester phosphodiesterase [Nesterenkonia lacusekhoensis]|uniref:Glycerophosphoryl diester phosphodiesterase n=1 Tax=Nesterenkonia lacusekhoensis TaxID=150832 RepID=A0ABS4T3N8_9MICC|nr:glycerophosphodiester phosphodiesterase family protein [Nesterenkonia lacusekhoensis]MBP2318579.1 glycerophosphoryl diester phosphodiesterase [Nesterenkonia lacusekhoensis]
MSIIRRFRKHGYATVAGAAFIAALSQPAQAASQADMTPSAGTASYEFNEPGEAAAVVGHRGNSGIAPENTMPAIVSSVASGADYFEIDINYTADGEIVALHDETVDRTTDGTGALRDLDYDYVSGLDAGSWFHPSYAGTQVPHFRDVLDYVSHSGAQMLLEYKDDWGSEQVAASAELIEEYGVEDQIIVQSFDLSTVENLQHQMPEVPRMVLGNITPDAIQTAHALGAIGYNPAAADVLENPEWVEEANDAGLAAFAWTVNDEEEWEALTESGVEAIITDYPDDLIWWNANQIRPPHPQG